MDKIYNKGFCMVMPYHMLVNNADYAWLRDIAAQCQHFTLGIPDDWVAARIYGETIPYSAKITQDALMTWGWFTDVIILDADHLSYQKAYELVEYDTCFYGTWFGKEYDKTLEFFKEKGIEAICMHAQARTTVEGGGSLRLALDNITRNQKVVLFGTGAYFDAYMKEFAVLMPKAVPAYAIDNDKDKWNTTKDNISILSPAQLAEEDTKSLLVIICARNYKPMIEQLKAMGDFEYRIMLFNKDISLLEEFAISAYNEKQYLIRSHEILTSLVKEFDRVCREHNIHYYVICGSLIGVVRHQGMIPWDDDIDIAIPRKDYKKLKKIAKKEWKDNDTFKFLNYPDIGGGAFLDCMPRLFYMKEKLPTKCFDKINGKAKADIEDRMFLDFYVMDNAHVNDHVHSFCIGAMKGIYNLMMGHRASVDYDEYRALVPESTIRLMKTIHTIGKIFPVKFLAFMYDAFARSGNWNKKAPDYIMESCAIRCIELKYKKKYFGEGQYLPFETTQVKVPSDYDGQLNDMRYYNYMEFPRMAVRKPSHYFNSDIEVW